MGKGNTFVTEPGNCSRLPEIRRTPDQEAALKATMKFMNTIGSKITLFLGLQEGNEIKNPIDEITMSDIKQIEAFFQEHPEVEINYDSEVANQRIKLSLQTLSVLKSGLAMRIYGKFLDLFDEKPSIYALNGIIESAKIYEQTEGINVIGEEEINRRKNILIGSLSKTLFTITNEGPHGTSPEKTISRIEGELIKLGMNQGDIDAIKTKQLNH